MDKIKPDHIVTVKKDDIEKEYHLSKPSWEVYKMAMQKYMTGSGELDLVGAGEVIVKGCYMGNDVPLDELMNDYKLFAMICLKAASIVEFFESDIKKN